MEKSARPALSMHNGIIPVGSYVSMDFTDVKTIAPIYPFVRIPQGLTGEMLILPML